MTRHRLTSTFQEGCKESMLKRDRVMRTKKRSVPWWYTSVPWSLLQLWEKKSKRLDRTIKKWRTTRILERTSKYKRAQAKLKKIIQRRHRNAVKTSQKERRRNFLWTKLHVHEGFRELQAHSGSHQKTRCYPHIRCKWCSHRNVNHHFTNDDNSDDSSYHKDTRLLIPELAKDVKLFGKEEMEWKLKRMSRRKAAGHEAWL